MPEISGGVHKIFIKNSEINDQVFIESIKKKHKSNSLHFLFVFLYNSDRLLVHKLLGKQSNLYPMYIKRKK